MGSVVIPNYMQSQSNCLAGSSFYSVCCFDECESLLGHVEEAIKGPSAQPSQLVEVVSGLHSDTVHASRNLSGALLSRLGQIADLHGGQVPLHGRLFAQWMHHAYPRECSFPHVSGTKNPQSPDEWMRQTQSSISLSESEMRRAVDDSRITDATTVEKDLLWSSEEELLVARKPTGSRGVMWGLLRLAMYCIAVLSASFVFPMFFKRMQGFPSSCSAVSGNDHELPKAHPTLLHASLSCRGKWAKVDKQLV